MNKTGYIMICAAVFAAMITVASAAPSPAAQQPSIDLDKYKGKTILVDFWASWCVPCQKSFPWMDAMKKKYGDKGLVILTVSLDKKKEYSDKFLSAFPGVDLPVVYDPEAKLAREWKLESMPTAYLVDKTGQLRYTHSGFLAAEASEYESRIVELLNE